MEKTKEPTNLPIRREMFCQYYTKNSTYRGNATMSYALAYHYNLESLPKDDAVFEMVEDGKGGMIEKEVVASSYQRAKNTCHAEGSRLLRFTKVQQRIIELLNEILVDEVVDAELAKVILQNRELTAKNTAIRMYNDIKGRVIKKTDLTSKGKQINNLDDETIDRVIAAREARTKRTDSSKPRS